MKTIAIITARGGSKRIPHKNIRDFCGRPIIAYSIEAALKSGAFDEVMVSTDSEEIADIAKKYGASVPFLRSAATSDDYATTRDVLMEVIDRYKELGHTFDYMACIYPTAPFVTSDRLNEAMKCMRSQDGNELVPVVRFSYPPQRSYVINNGLLSFKYKEYESSRSQDLEPFYHDAGQYYIYKVSEYLKCNGSIHENIIPQILPESEVQDIDTEDDWIIAEQKFRAIFER